MAPALPPTYVGVDTAAPGSFFYWSVGPATNTAPLGQWTYVARQEPALSPAALAAIHLVRARRWEVVVEPRAMSHRAARQTIAPRTRRAGRQPVSRNVRHVRSMRRRG